MRKDVYTEKQLEAAVNAQEETIILHGEVAEKVARKYRTRKVARRGGVLLALAGIVADPFTSGTSLISAIAGAPAGATVTISTAELMVLAGTVMAIKGINRGYNVEFRTDGSVELNRK